jgi:hypothetical protein
MAVCAGVTGRGGAVRFLVGEIVNPFMRPGGVLILTEPTTFAPGFGQLEAQVTVGMAAEATCASKP